MTNSIGSYQFISLLGRVEPPTEQLDRPIVRLGVAGVGLQKTGVRGVPFTLRSAVDQTDLAAAHLTLAAYRALVGADPVVLIQDGFNFSTGNNFTVAVLGVHDARISSVAGSSGGLNSPSLAKLVCHWGLIAIANP